MYTIGTIVDTGFYRVLATAKYRLPSPWARAYCTIWLLGTAHLPLPEDSALPDRRIKSVIDGPRNNSWPINPRFCSVVDMLGPYG